MKKIIMLVLAIAMMCLVACNADTPPSDQETPNEELLQATETKEPTPEPTPETRSEQTPVPTSEPTDEPAVEPTVLSSEPIPANLISSELNLFSDVRLPKGYVVYAATIQKNGDEYDYVLSMIAHGGVEDIVTYISNLLGIEDENMIQHDIQKVENDGGWLIDGTENNKGLKAFCDVEKTEQDNWEYEYVDGYDLALTAQIDESQLPEYIGVIENNFNLNALGETSHYFDVMPLPEFYDITANLHNNSTMFSASYNVENGLEIRDDFFTDIESSNIGDGHMDVVSDNRVDIVYGKITSTLHIEPDMIFLHQSIDGLQTVLGEYTPQITLEFIGFLDTEDSEPEFKDEENNDLMITINKSEWGEPEYEDGKDAIRYQQQLNGYFIMVKYYPNEKRFVVFGDKDGSQAEYSYLIDMDEYKDEWMGDELDTAREYFSHVFEISESEETLKKPIDLFNESIAQYFQLNADELFELPRQE